MGVIDNNGQQWEHCNGCGKLVRIDHLHYEQASDQYRHGRDLCHACYRAPVMVVRSRKSVDEAGREVYTETYERNSSHQLAVGDTIQFACNGRGRGGHHQVTAHIVKVNHKTVVATESFGSYRPGTLWTVHRSTNLSVLL